MSDAKTVSTGIAIPHPKLEKIHDLYRKREILEFTYGLAWFNEQVDELLKDIGIPTQQKEWLLDSVRKIHQ